MIAIVTIGAYSDTSVDFVEHPDREELLSTLRALERECDLDIIGVAEHVELFGWREERRPSTLADIAFHKIVRAWSGSPPTFREDVLGVLPPQVRREALTKRLAHERTLLARQVEDKWRKPEEIARQKWLCQMIETRLAQEDAEPKDACWGIAT